MPLVSGARRSRFPVWRQLAIGLALFGFYVLVDAIPGEARRRAADRHGRDLYDLEQSLQLDVVQSWNSWLAQHETLSVLANYEYAFTYIASALLLLAWVYLRHPEAFGWVRDSFVVLNVLAISCFAVYPVTPPRLLTGLGVVDTVARDGTWGSWGTGPVDAANQIAAMPSLHVGWALWVSVALARLTAGWWVQLISAVHVVLTVLVIVATANHFVLDAAGAAVVVAAAIALGDARQTAVNRRGGLVDPEDAFFLHVESSGAAQHVGGLVLFEPTGDTTTPSVEQVRDLVHAELPGMPRFRQRASRPGRWRRPRWIQTPRLDWDWHVSERTSPDGVAGMHRIVAELAETPLPRDRPLWRIVLIREVGAGQSAFLIVMHHAAADGIGTVLHALRLMRPRVDLPRGGSTAPGALRTAAATVTGLAQLATDGSPSVRLPDGSPRRDYARAALDLDTVRRVAHDRGVRVTDLVLAVVADALATTHPTLTERLRGKLRVSVPLMVQEPGATAEGNATAAVMLDVPADDRGVDALLPEIVRRSARLRTPTRAIAARFVMTTGLRLLPEPLVGWFARTVYGRRFFHLVVSNMPGPTPRLSLAGVPFAATHPILPLAPGAPLALGALSWTGVLSVGVTTDPEVLDATLLAARIETTLGTLTASATTDEQTVS